MIGLIDFDGTVVFHVPENICEEETGAERVLKRLVKKGHKLILWTCRNNSEDNPYNHKRNGEPKRPNSIEEAINWYKERNIPLYAVNENPLSKQYIGTSAKPLCDFCIDDVNVGTPLIVKEVICKTYDGIPYKVVAHCVDWEKLEKILENSGIL